MLYCLCRSDDFKCGVAKIIKWEVGDDFGEDDVQTFGIACMGRTVELNVEGEIALCRPRGGHGHHMGKNFTEQGAANGAVQIVGQGL